MQASVLPLGTQHCGYVSPHLAVLLKELRLFLSVLPVPSQDLAQRENQEVLLPLYPPASLGGRRCPRKVCRALNARLRREALSDFHL